MRELLPKELVVEAGGARIGMAHVPGPGAGRAERLARRFPGCDAVVYGHTHLPEVVRQGAVWILNPGSPTERRRAPSHTMLLLEIEAGGARIGMAHVPGPLAGRAGRLVKRFPGCDAVVYGHTHIPEVSREGKVWVLNPGSPTERRKAPSHTMLLLRVGRGGAISPELLVLEP